MTSPIFTKRAEHDLHRIGLRSMDLFGFRQAQRYVRLLTESAALLSQDPRKGKPFDADFPHHRRFLVGRHYLIYRQRADGRVLIVRVLHSRMDLGSHL